MFVRKTSIYQGFFSMNLLDLFSAQKLTEGNETVLQIENLCFKVVSQ